VDRVALQRLLEDLLNLLPAFHSRQMQKAERDLNWPSCPWVFHYLGKPIGGHIKGFVEACVKAGLPKLRAHDLRRSAIRNMERAAVPRSTAMKFSGHKTESVYRRYDIVSQQDMKLAAAKMENYLEGLKSRNITTKTTTVEEKPN
jgi:integrase